MCIRDSGNGCVRPDSFRTDGDGLLAFHPACQTTYRCLLYTSVKGLNLSQMRFLGHLNLLNPLKRFAVLLHVKGLKNPKSLIFAYWDT